MKPPTDLRSQLYLPDGAEVRVGAMLGRGGEGSVYAITDLPRLVVKVWKDSNTRVAAAKLESMVSNAPALRIDGQTSPAVIWPQDLVVDKDGRPAGYTMPLVDPGKFGACFRYFNPATREERERRTGRKFGRPDLYRLARNLARATTNIHAAGYVIGDVNENNVMTDDRMEVALVDTDSYQVRVADRTLRCPRGREDYTPPRLQGLLFQDHDRTPDDDNFGLAVLVFKMLMNGMHPYASTSDPDNENTVVSLGQKIKLGYFPYNESGHVPDEHQPSASYQDAWQRQDFELRHLFRRAFDPQAAAGLRPTASEWSRELERAAVDEAGTWTRRGKAGPAKITDQMGPQSTKQPANPTPATTTLAASVRSFSNAINSLGKALGAISPQGRPSHPVQQQPSQPAAPPPRFQTLHSPVEPKCAGSKFAGSNTRPAADPANIDRAAPARGLPQYDQYRSGRRRAAEHQHACRHADARVIAEVHDRGLEFLRLQPERGGTGAIPHHPYRHAPMPADRGGPPELPDVRCRPARFQPDAGAVSGVGPPELPVRLQRDDKNQPGELRPAEL